MKSGMSVQVHPADKRDLPMEAKCLSGYADEKSTKSQNSAKNVLPKTGCAIERSSTANAPALRRFRRNIAFSIMATPSFRDRVSSSLLPFLSPRHEASCRDLIAYKPVDRVTALPYEQCGHPLLQSPGGRSQSIQDYVPEMGGSLAFLRLTHNRRCTP